MGYLEIRNRKNKSYGIILPHVDVIINDGICKIDTVILSKYAKSKEASVEMLPFSI